MTRVIRGISLEDWEEKTQLSENELQSVYDLQDACAELPLPSNWTSSSPAVGRLSGLHTPDSFSNAQLITPFNAGALTSRLNALSTRPRSSTNLLIEASVAGSEAQTRSVQEIGADKPIETLQQFFDWFASMESEMEKDQEDVYRNYLKVVSLYRQSCDVFLDDLKETTGLFDHLDDEYGFVEERTRSLQTACETLLNEQERLTRLADALADRLAYFNQLEPIAKLFNSPGEGVCLHPDFVPMLQKLDDCIEYMQQHLKYRDAELYLMRFRQCMTRGMTVIKMYLVASVKTLGYDVYKKLSTKSSDLQSMSKQTTLLYVKFRMLSSTIKPLSIELAKRCEGHKEYQSLYQDIINAYFQTRQNLLGPVISRKIQEFGPNHGDLLAFTRNGCAYMMGLCLDEFNLFFNLFPSGDDDLYSYLEMLTSYLYDYLRTRIIHENDIFTLSELCNIFQMYVARESELATENNDNDSQHMLEFGHLIANVLEDAQGRLVFRAQAYIHNEIQSYQPKPEDYELRAVSEVTANAQKNSVVLDGPNAIEEPNKELPATLTVMTEDESDSQSAIMKHTDDVKGEKDLSLREGTNTSLGWFPTLQKTLWILSKLYHCVQTVVFEDIAQEAVSLCNESLRKAYEVIIARKSRLDGQLFMIKHLLVLKEQLAPFEVNLVHCGKELDFSHVTDTLTSLQQNRSLIFNPNTLIGLAQRGMPRVVEISLDSRREIDRELKRVCEDFISDCVHGAVEPLTKFMIKASVTGSSHNKETAGSFADNIRETMDQFKESASERIRFVVKKLHEYVADYKIEQILMKPIQVLFIHHSNCVCVG
ncbi:Sec34-like family-domain-containing protein [Dichotomocladium elegans]|nr:Sec34-like family-domain-containing protein [Dichotomocladium elegans]